MKTAVLAAFILAAAALSGAQAQAQAQAQTQPQPEGQLPQSADAAYSAASLYNLGNSYARAGKPGMAVLNYERAALLAPKDPDIEANLNYVRASAHVRPQQSGRVSRIVTLASPNMVAWIGVCGIIVIGASLLSASAAPRLRALRVAAGVLGVTALGFTTCNALVQWPKLREAVVIVKETPIRVSPVPMGDALLQLTEAETVTILAQHEDFVLVRTHGGRDGWAARADLADVVPKATLR